MSDEKENRLLFLENVLASIPDAVVTADTQHNILEWNLGAEKLFGYSAAEACGRKLVDLITGGKAEIIDEIAYCIQKIHKGESIPPTETIRYRKDGIPVNVIMSVAHLWSGDEWIGGISVYTDITERKRTEILIESMNTATIAIQKAMEPGQIFTAVSKELEKIGVSCAIFALNESKENLIPVYLSYRSQYIRAAEKLTGLSALKFAIPIDSVETNRQAIRERKSVFLSDLKETTKQALPRPIAILADSVTRHLRIKKSIYAPLMVDDDVIGLFSVQSDDLRESDIPAITAFANQLAAAWQKAQLYEKARQEISARIEAEGQIRLLNEELERRVAERTAELQSANKELESLAYSISHDLRAPLRAINGYAQILVEDYGSALDEEGIRVCSVIVNEAQRMGRLIDALLTFLRLGRADMQLFSIDMQALAQSVFDELTIASGAEQIDLRLGVLPDAIADPFLIRQVWVNLLSNAVKFSRHRQPAIIEVGSTRDADHHTIYWVRDNGVGFDMQHVDKLFGVFNRLHSDQEFEGTGVGLAIVQRVIQRHSGRVWATGEVNRGATFFFSLPTKGSNS